MENIPAIPTRYDGHDFRSRLEARYAVFFNAIHQAYEYEPGYFDLGNGIRYAPDFVLHGVKGRFEGDLYIEVKGCITPKDIYKFNHCPKPLLVVGSIPDPENFREDMLQQFYDSSANIFSCTYIDGDSFGAVLGAGINGGAFIDDENNNYYGIDEELTRDAFMTARLAQFEKQKGL